MKNNFIVWYNNVFKTTQLYLDMCATTESSPFHQERSVAVHTNMVIMEYMANYSTKYGTGSNKQEIGAFAVAFHDVGKPTACQLKFREDRGEYKAFHGHEQISARLWENWAVQNWSMLVDQFNFTATDIFRVGFIVEHHKPWKITDTRKLNNLARTLLEFNIDDVFLAVLKSDNAGRIPTEAQTTYDANIWCNEFEARISGLTGIKIDRRYSTLLETNT